MTKHLIGKAKLQALQLIENQCESGSTAAPHRVQAGSAAARATPPGGPLAASVCPSLRPHAAISAGREVRK